FFCPLVLETTGGINSEGTSALKQIFRFGSSRLNLTHSVYAGRGWAGVSANLQSSVAQAILTRTCGWDPFDEEREEKGRESSDTVFLFLPFLLSLLLSRLPSLL